MSVQDIIRAYYGTYEPTNVYAFEFRRAVIGTTITTVYLLLPPESVSVSEPQLADIIPTLGGGYITDYGAGFKDITIQGSLNFYFADTPGSGDAQPVDGYTEFMKLRYILSRYRDFTMTDYGKSVPPPGMDASVIALAKSRGLADRVDVVFHDYDYDEHFYVKVENFSITRDKSDPWTVKYDIALKAYLLDDSGKGRSFTPEKRKNKSAWINEAYKMMMTAHPATIPTDMPQLSVYDTPAPIPNVSATAGESVPVDIGANQTLYRFNQELKTYRLYLAWAVGMLQSGVMSPERALARADNLSGKDVTTTANI